MHSGRTDSKGGHNDRINGGYHYHHGESAHLHQNGICELENNNYSPWTLPLILLIVLLIFWKGKY